MEYQTPTARAPIDLSECEREPIHVPGAIQPHGALLAADADSLLVTHASANLLAVLGRAPDSVLGRTLRDAIGAAACTALLHAASADDAADGRSRATLARGGGTLDLLAHRSGGTICVDIERTQAPGPHERRAASLETVLGSFSRAASALEICALAVTGLKALTGFDRVMAYRFDTDMHGEIVAEAREPWMEPYLGLHYPAGDVPVQSRRLMLRQPVGCLPDVDYEPVPVLALPGAPPLDLTGSPLRSMSPLHREYLRNMKVAASLSVALIPGQLPGARQLWGMLVCHNATPRDPGPDMRKVVGLIGQVVSLLLRSLVDSAIQERQSSRQAMLGPLVDLVAGAPDAAAIQGAASRLLGLVEAEGALLHLSGQAIRLGETPPPPVADHAMALLRKVADGRIMAFDDVPNRFPDLAGVADHGSGALVVPLGYGSDDAILWFRPERARAVTWGGDPVNHVIVDPATGRLHPRASFAAWKETVRGRSAAWTDANLAIARAFRDAWESKVAERTKAELARLRFYDDLTGLPNRSLLQEHLTKAETAGDATVALLFLDLDRFKSVNDTMGHSAGDVLLIEVARRLSAVAGPGQIAARLGGDEFVVLCQGLDRDAVAAMGARVRRAIEQPFDIDGRSCHVSASIGIAVGAHAEGLDLVRAADMAMYEAKRAGGNREVIFEPSLFDTASMRFEVEHEMRAALAAGDQFVLLYQPLFGIVQGVRRLAGFEALVRWRHPRRGWMSPGLFIPLAEKSGLIFPLGDWVVATALRQGLVLRQAYPHADLVMNVNVSALQIPRAGFRDGIAGALDAEGYPASALCLEVTESMLTDASAAAVLAEIRKIGVQVAIDDFGVGYSSLSYLRRLPVDSVKLDRSFLEDVEGDPRGKGFVGAVIALAHAAGKPVVFEGIETQGQLDIALATGADVVQGFFFSPPLSANAAEALVSQFAQLDSQPAVPAGAKG